MGMVLLAMGLIVPKNEEDTEKIEAHIREKFGKKIRLDGGIFCLEEGVWAESRDGKVHFGFEEEANLVFEADLLHRQRKVLDGISDLVESGHVTYVYEWGEAGEEQDFMLVFDETDKAWDIAPCIGTYLTDKDANLIFRALDEYWEQHPEKRRQILNVKKNLMIDVHTAMANVRI